MQTLLMRTVCKVRKFLYFPVDAGWQNSTYFRAVWWLDRPMRSYIVRRWNREI
jgi:hypothetical protein